MKHLTFKIFLYIVTVSFLLSCSSDDQPSSETTVEKSDNIEASKSIVAPLEMIQLHSKITLSQESYKAQFLGNEIILGKFDDSTLVFMMPQNLANKEGELTFLVQGKQEEIKFKVSQLNLATNSDEEIRVFLEGVDEGVDTSSGNPTLDQYGNIFQENLAAFNTIYTSLSNEDKIIVASIIKINFSNDAPGRMLSKQEAYNCFSENQNLVNNHWFNVKISALFMTTSLLITEPLISKAVAIVSSVKFVKSVYKMTEAGEDLALCPALGTFYSFNNFIRTEGETLKYQNKVEYKLKFFGKYEGLSKKDLNGSSPTKKSLAASINILNTKLNDLKKQYNQFVEFLGLSSLSLNVPDLLPNDPLISETKEIDNTKITQVSISTNKAIVKKNGLEGSDYIMSFSNKTIEKQYFDIQVEGVDDGFSAKGTFHAELEASDGKIVVQDGNEKAANENNEAMIVLTVLNEEETPAENGKIEVSSTSSDVSFPSGSNFTTGANGQVNFKVKISEESSESKFIVVIKLKNEAGEVKDETNVTVNVDIASRLINGSPWKVTSFIQDGWDTFNEMETGNETCYPTGVFDKQKMLEATYNFSQGSANMNYIMEYRKWNCSTSSYDTSKGYQSFGHSWRIDNSTGKFVVTREGNEVAWLSVQVSGEKISLSGPHIMDNGEETTWTIRIEKP